jgi:Histidine kinase-, DNA gyrase B-, and HSP90-like ATPase
MASSASLVPNLVKRVERLPKPTNVAGAMQPLFEAISNSIHSTQAKFGDTASRRGKIVVTVSTNRRKENVWATVEDNGEGLNKANWEAFKTTDTDNKIQIGGKGVGRLLWLDCFKKIEIVSVFRNGLARRRRSFQFVLSLRDQIRDERVSSVPHETETFLLG